MSAAATTPCSVMFSTLKKQGGITYKELAGLILSGKPLSDGKSPVSRINDRTWISRFIVHAPAGTLQEKYFCDFGIGALRIVSRLRSKEGKALSSQQIFDLVAGPAGESMVDALAVCRQDVSLYRNVLVRLRSSVGFTYDERAEVAMVLYLVAGCTADVQRAASVALDFLQSVGGGRLVTPVTMPSFDGVQTAVTQLPPSPKMHLQLLRVVDGYVSGMPHWVDPASDGAEIGSLATGPSDITDVGPDVSAHHARIWYGEDGSWYVQGLKSRNGVRLVDGATRKVTIVEPPHDSRDGYEPHPIPIRPGDELVLASDTAFLVMEGLPS